LAINSLRDTFPSENNLFKSSTPSIKSLHLELVRISYTLSLEAMQFTIK
jgi:hypothetical protein